MRRRNFVASSAALAVAAAPRGARAQAVKTSIGVLRLASSGPLFIAIERGYFRGRGSRSS